MTTSFSVTFTEITEADDKYIEGTLRHQRYLEGFIFRPELPLFVRIQDRADRVKRGRQTRIRRVKGCDLAELLHRLLKLVCRSLNAHSSQIEHVEFHAPHDTTDVGTTIEVSHEPLP